jgi:acetyl-CoA carboxylase biotin carboxylase subunit
MGLKTNIPFHQQLVDSHHFISGKFDTSFIERYYHPEETPGEHEEEAAILATLVEHIHRQAAAQVIRANERDTSNWKWVGRYERIHR